MLIFWTDQELYQLVDSIVLVSSGVTQELAIILRPPPPPSRRADAAGQGVHQLLRSGGGVPPRHLGHGVWRRLDPEEHRGGVQLTRLRHGPGDQAERLLRPGQGDDLAGRRAMHRPGDLVAEMQTQWIELQQLRPRRRRGGRVFRFGCSTTTCFHIRFSYIACCPNTPHHRLVFLKGGECNKTNVSQCIVRETGVLRALRCSHPD